MAFSKGETVSWNWGSGVGSGTVTKVYTGRITRKLKGQEITRNASNDNPAYSIEQDDGDEVLKLHSELREE